MTQVINKPHRLFIQEGHILQDVSKRAARKVNRGKAYTLFVSVYRTHDQSATQYGQIREIFQLPTLKSRIVSLYGNIKTDLTLQSVLLLIN